MLTGRQILATEPNKVFNDQEYILGADALEVSDCFWTYATTSTNAFGGVPDAPTVGRYVIDGNDRSGLTITNNELSHAVSVYAWVDPGETGQVWVGTTAVASSSTTFSVTNTTPAWQTYRAINIKTNDTEDTITVKVRSTLGDNIYIAGIVIMG